MCTLNIFYYIIFISYEWINLMQRQCLFFSMNSNNRFFCLFGFLIKTAFEIQVFVTLRVHLSKFPTNIRVCVCVDILCMFFMYVCNPCNSFTWHPHGRHYVNICEPHLEAFLHVKCLAVSLLQAEGPFAVTNQVSLLHLHSYTTKRRVEPRPANVGKCG